LHLVCWTASRDAGDSNPARVEILFKISFPHAPLANWTLMSSWAHCQWDDETVRKRIGHPPSYAKAKKMKSLTLHTHGCHIASLRECSFLVFFVLIVIISLLFFYCYYFSLLVYIYVFIAIISLLLFLFLLLLFLFFYFCFYCYYFSSSIFVFLVIISLLLFFWLLLLLFLFFCFWLLLLLFVTSFISCFYCHWLWFLGNWSASKPYDCCRKAIYMSKLSFCFSLLFSGWNHLTSTYSRPENWSTKETAG